MVSFTLASVRYLDNWYRDLADLGNDGHLTREGFAVAMYIINSRLAGNEIPSTLPPSLVPPSMRTSQLSSMPAINEPQFDLLLDDLPSSYALQPEQTGGNTRIQPPSSAFGHSLGKGASSPSYAGVVPPLVQSQESSVFRPG
jgi:epidermal growth factor receptor substrate 15